MNVSEMRRSRSKYRELKEICALFNLSDHSADQFRSDLPARECKIRPPARTGIFLTVWPNYKVFD